jgi:hypothetical protein
VREREGEGNWQNETAKKKNKQARKKKAKDIIN